MGSLWVEVLNEGLIVTWLWKDGVLGAVPTTMDDYHLDEDTMHAISQYAEDKETNLNVKAMYEESDFDGTLEEFTKAGAPT